MHMHIFAFICHSLHKSSNRTPQKNFRGTRKRKGAKYHCTSAASRRWRSSSRWAASRALRAGACICVSFAASSSGLRFGCLTASHYGQVLKSLSMVVFITVLDATRGIMAIQGRATGSQANKQCPSTQELVN